MKFFLNFILLFFLVACTGEPTAGYAEATTYGIGTKATVNGISITINQILSFDDSSETYLSSLHHKGYYLLVLNISIENKSPFPFFAYDTMLVDDAANHYRLDFAGLYGFEELKIVDSGDSAQGYVAFEVPPTPLLDGNLHLEWESDIHKARATIYLDTPTAE